MSWKLRLSRSVHRVESLGSIMFPLRLYLGNSSLMMDGRWRYISIPLASSGRLVILELQQHIRSVNSAISQVISPFGFLSRLDSLLTLRHSS